MSRLFGNSARLNETNRPELSRHTHRRGFSLVETLVVVGIVMVVSAIAIPKLTNAIYKARVRSAAVELSALIQQARTTAEQRNNVVPFYAGTSANGLAGAFISCSTANCPGGTQWAAGDPFIAYGSGVSNSNNPPTALNPGYQLQGAGTTLYLTPLGSAANTAAGTNTNPTQGWAFYVTDGRGNWGAVSVSPMGRSKVWLYSARAWH